MAQWGVIGLTHFIFTFTRFTLLEWYINIFGTGFKSGYIQIHLHISFFWNITKNNNIFKYIRKVSRTWFWNKKMYFPDVVHTRETKQIYNKWLINFFYTWKGVVGYQFKKVQKISLHTKRLKILYVLCTLLCSNSCL